MTATHNSHRTHVCIHQESAIGSVPADAAAWATAEALGDLSAFRIFTEALDPAFILGAAAVPNADMMTRVGEALPPHKGLETADGGSMTLRMTGNGETYSTGVQVAETALGVILGHCLGGNSRGSHAEITVVTSTTIFEVDDIGDLAVGQVIGFQDVTAGAFADRVFPAIILEIAGVEITVDRVMPFTVAVGDRVIGAETAYYDQAALTNPEDAGASTLSILIAKGPNAWVAGGAHLALENIAVERGQQPKLSMPILAAKGYPPDSTGGVAVPTFTGTIQGQSDIRVIGRDTMARLATAGATTTSAVSLFSCAIQVGCPVLAQDTVTEESSGSPGRVGYRTEPAETIATVVMALNSAQLTQWTAGTRVTFTFYQVAPIGYGWCVHFRNAFLAGPPKPTVADVNKYEVMVRASDERSAATELASSKILVARY